MVTSTPRDEKRRANLRVVTAPREVAENKARPEPPVDDRGAAPAGRPIDRHVGRRIQRRRVELNLTLRCLGERLGLPEAVLETFEDGSVRVGAARLVDLGAFLNVPPSYFFQDSEPAAPRLNADSVSQAMRPPTAASDFQSRTMTGIYNKINDLESRNEIIAFALAKLRDEKARNPDAASPETN